jgi:8-oxo-dGTP pyrophosphatase MutT (NUDIX family)
MPLHEGAKPGSKEFGENIATEIKAGKKPAQAEAIAYRESGEHRSDSEAPIRAAGILFLTPENQALFLKRGLGGDFPGFWCLPGGKHEGTETLEETAVREATEEAKGFPDGSREELARTISKGLPAPLNADLPGEAAPSQSVDFTTFVQRIDKAFEPAPDEEHVGHAWTPASQPPEPLHPGVAIALRRLTADELGIARMMAQGELTSPQRYMNVSLFALRITGTGAAIRKEKKDKKTGDVIRPEEYVWRKPENYLNPDFVARCNGLSVIWDHPEGATLDSDEFGQRIIGSVMLPFIGDGVHFPADEVWGISKIYDAPAALVMEKMQLSTSPTVVLGSEDDPDIRLIAEDGKTILIEGTPKLLDHVAIAGRGVWDKGGKPTGVLSNTIYGDGETEMTEEEKAAAADKARKDAEEKEAKEKADREKADADRKTMADAMGSMADSLKSLKERMDSIEGKADKACADAEEAKKKAEGTREDARKDGESEEDWKERMDKKRKDAEEEEAKAKKDAEEKAEKEKADAQAKADAAAGIGEIRKQVQDLVMRTQPRSAEDKAKFADAQARADGAYIMLGRQAPAPMDGESLPDYRRRLATGLKAHSPSWKDVKLDAIADDAAFTPIEKQIFDDAISYARRPAEHGSTQLRTVTRKLESGHTVNEFYGPPGDWMNRFAGNRQRATGDFKKSVGGAR